MKRNTILLHIKTIALCFFCLAPGSLMIDFLGPNFYTKLALFWGGSFYVIFIKRFNLGV